MLCQHHLLQYHQYHPLFPPVQLPIPPAQPIPAQPIQPAHIPQLHWSHSKPEFTGKPYEDAEAHLLRMNDWMDTHAFKEGVKVQCLCLTLVGEARLWYESLRPINVVGLGYKTNSFLMKIQKCYIHMLHT